uniref:Uncharacterized protein n=1 Tax=Physcomitrium patens TaxID=3218 RepID=A0A2K1KX11_PHYPA|nr:hypothetical protein PHYPA_005313 [Physcomitrium patens]
MNAMRHSWMKSQTLAQTPPGTEARGRGGIIGNPRVDPPSCPSINSTSPKTRISSTPQQCASKDRYASELLSAVAFMGLVWGSHSSSELERIVDARAHYSMPPAGEREKCHNDAVQWRMMVALGWGYQFSS